LELSRLRFTAVRSLLKFLAYPNRRAGLDLPAPLPACGLGEFDVGAARSYPSRCPRATAASAVRGQAFLFLGRAQTFGERLTFSSGEIRSTLAPLVAVQTPHSAPRRLPLSTSVRARTIDGRNRRHPSIAPVAATLRAVHVTVSLGLFATDPERFTD
jgi:hypothetical protein